MQICTFSGDLGDCQIDFEARITNLTWKDRADFLSFLSPSVESQYCQVFHQQDSFDQNIFHFAHFITQPSVRISWPGDNIGPCQDGHGTIPLSHQKR